MRAAQTLVVSGTGSADYLRIGEAMAFAQPGDRVLVEPGEYRERVVVADSVDLVARVPGSVIISRPDGLHPSVPSLSAGGTSMARVSGVRVTSAGEVPATAVSASGAGLALNMVDISHHGRAMEIAPGSSITMHGSRVGVATTLISVPETSQVGFSNNIFVRNGGSSAEPPIVAAATSRLTLTGNVFAGFPPEIVRGLSAARRTELLAGNIVVPPAGKGPRRAAGAAH